MGRVRVVVVACAFLAGCTSTDPAGSDSPSASPSGAARSAEPVASDAGSCPVPDEAFCGAAVEVLRALQAGDTERLFALSRRDRLVCADLATEYFPGCRTQEVLRGHALGGATFVVEVVDDAGYRGQLGAIFGNVDPTFEDDLGDGSIRLVGVGTCGPDIPGRRTYHLAWTAAVSERGAPPERVLSSFELTFEDDWRIALWYLDTLDAWETEQTDPLELAFCEAGRTPWRA